MADTLLLTPKECGSCTDMLREAREKLGLEMGIVSHIVENKYHVMAIDATQHMIVPGEIFALEDTVCNAVIQEERFVSLTSYLSPEGLREHPVYEAMKLEAYVAAPIWVNQKIWGTVNFTSTITRPHAFTDDEKKLVRECAKTVSKLLASH